MSLDEVVDRIRSMAERDALPSNVSEMLKNAADELEDEERELSVRVNAASSILDEVSNDPNIRQHTRTEIWNIASKVEGLD